jgi:probable rRNA maturation factor
MTLSVDVVVNASAWEAALPDLSNLAERVVRESLAASGATLAADCELCVAFCDDAEVRALNAAWRGQDKSTNVLSFPTPGPLAQKPLLGDVAIAYETVAREAAEQRKTLHDHTAHMIIHGFLHLIGYDHVTQGEAEAMEALERRVAQALGISDPYADDAGETDQVKSYVDED